MTSIAIPTKETVNTHNKVIFENLESKMGFVPNLLAMYAHSDTALADYLAFQNRMSLLTKKEKEVINLITSEVNSCEYCLSAHSDAAKLTGMSNLKILELRTGRASFNDKLDALAGFVKDICVRRGKPSMKSLHRLLNVGYTKDKLVDIITHIGEAMIGNFIQGATKTPIDFPLVPALSGTKEAA